MRYIPIVICSVALAGCGSKTLEPAIEIKTVEVIKEIQRPCGVAKPTRPVELKRVDVLSIATDAVRQIYARLQEWQGHGGYGDQASDALDICISE